MEYWTIIDNRHAGPFTAEQLVEMGILPDTPVWHDGLPDWVHASEVQEIVDAINRRYGAPGAPVAGPAPEPQTMQPCEPEPQPRQEPQPCEPCEPDATGAPTTQAPQEAPANNPAYSGYSEPAPQPTDPRKAPASTFSAPAPPAAQYAPAPQGECPPAYLGWAIVSTILCCLPLGVAGIVCAALTKSAWRSGDIAKAKKMSDRAQWLIILAVVCGVLAIPFQIAFSSFPDWIKWW